ncbi:MAG: hypothetical protein FWF71_07230 [Actinomycetia bacterium]|nr:hypothetical protein [Actinomycetes bacterium]
MRPGGNGTPRQRFWPAGATAAARFPEYVGEKVDEIPILAWDDDKDDDNYRLGDRYGSYSTTVPKSGVLSADAPVSMGR